MLSSRLLYDVFVSRVSQTRDNIRGVKGSMLSSRLLDHVFVSCVSQTRDNKRGVKGSMYDLTDARRTCYPLHHVYCLWFDSHGTRTHHLTDARRA
jgi:DNA-binding HxlR family transcriptional regulator